MLPLVSILIPCFNAERWLKECIESALAQTYPSKEIVVVDDGSTDRSTEVARSFGTHVRVQRNEHLGGNATRNHLLRLSRGEWLQYLDADDYLLPDKIAGQMQRVLKDEPQPDVIYGSTFLLDEFTGERRLAFVDPNVDPYLHFIQWTGFTTNSLLLRKSATAAAGGWDESLACCQERELVLRLIMNNARFVFVEEAGAVYRYHGTSSVSRRNPKLVTEQRVLLVERLISFLIERGLLKRRHARAAAVARIECARTLYQHDPEIARSLFRKATANYGRLLPAGPATPWSYRLALAVFGFDRAETIAKRMRTFRRK